MSDTALKNARMSDALERSLIREAIKAETLSGPFSRMGWRRLKLRRYAGGRVPRRPSCPPPTAPASRT